MNKKVHGRENDSVKVVDQVEKSDVALREEAILAFWQEHDVFKKSLETPAGSEPVGDFVFYDGPPFATGLPHYGHILAGTMKDAIPRFWTMNGYRVRRQWGWDCHGLPLENIIEKEFGLSNKKDIEDFGIKNFNEKARDAVMRYADDWREVVPRMGRFVDMEDDYRTMDASYTESVWWVFKQLFDKGLVFEGFKSMHLSPKSGTTLSNFEVNLGYQDIKDIAVTVRLPLLDEAGALTDTSLLVWTTTPWTMPGNLAAAVHNDIEYVKVKVATEDGTEQLILAKGRLAQLGDLEYEEVSTMKGSELVGRTYQPPFDYIQNLEGKEQLLVQNAKESFENAWTIYHADYVEVGEEGTGAVHIAPAYGEDDLILAQKHGVPIFHHVDYEGRFKDFVTDFAGQLVKPKDDDEAGVTHLDADIEIVKALKANGTLLKKENITHSYPHDWRNGAPLLNYATTSWFVDVPKIKEQLLAQNNTVNWVPGHVGKNRFGKWLEGARDWAVSRQRYWGAPLPIWKHPETEEVFALGSLEELKTYVPKSGNTYHIMRHGESEKNTLNVVTDAIDKYPVTEKGLADIEKAAATVDEPFDYIFTSPVLRTRQTAEAMAKHLGVAAENIIVDERIMETGHGVTDGQLWSDFVAAYPNDKTRFTSKPENGESWNDIRERMGAFIYSLEKEYAGKRILIVSHGHPLHMLEAAMKGSNQDQILADFESSYIQTGELRQIDFTPIPHNDFYELDFHRPYIDDVVLEKDGVQLERIPDVFDCWFESGAMPYAQHHYPFACDEQKFATEHFPANFIAEGLDQTRGWFYSLLVLGTALFGKSPYENVIVNGLVLAEDGKKMSKSLQNYPDPMELADRTGVDAMRFYLLSSPIIRGEDLNFSEKEVQEIQRKNIGRLHNVLAMYEMFADGTAASSDSTNALDVWICNRLHQLIADSTSGYKSYELDKATRPITDFIDDVSVWYLRRSRDRLKGEDVADKTAALATLRYILRELALVMAPVMPFYAEHLWQVVKQDTDESSVHLSAWPQAPAVDEAILEEMRVTREIVTAALEARTKAGIKVRQPIQSVTGPALAESLTQVVLDELNAKTYDVGAEITIDMTLTDALLAEGAVRELMRAVQGARKDIGLEPADRIVLTVQADDMSKQAVSAHEAMLAATVGATEIVFADVVDGATVAVGAYSFGFAIKKV